MIPLAIDVVNVLMIQLHQASSYPYEKNSNSNWWLFALIPIILSLIIAFVEFWKNFRLSKGKTPRDVMNRNRRKSLTAWAQLRGLNSNPTAGVVIAGRYWHLKCLQRGEGHFAYNVMEGIVSNRKVCAFDYHYEIVKVDQYENRTVMAHCYFSAVVVETDFQLKPMIIHAENIINRIAEYTGLHDINFESMEFNNKFHVKASDRRWAYDVVNQVTMELLLNHCRYNIELNGNYIIAYRDDLFSPGYFEEALQLLTGIVDNLPKPLSG